MAIRWTLDYTVQSYKWEAYSFCKLLIWYESFGSPLIDLDRIFGPANSTQEMYNQIYRDVTKSSMEGFNGTIFAYGQTSSGKTFTMKGTQDKKGVIPLAVEDMFSYMTQNPERLHVLRVSYIGNNQTHSIWSRQKFTTKFWKTSWILMKPRSLRFVKISNEASLSRISRKKSSHHETKFCN